MPPTPRKRKGAVTQSGKTIKTSVVVGADLFSRWAAASALKGISRNAYLAEALENATKSIVLFDRARKHDPVDSTDRLDVVPTVDFADENAA